MCNVSMESLDQDESAALHIIGVKSKVKRLNAAFKWYPRVAHEISLHPSEKCQISVFNYTL